MSSPESGTTDLHAVLVPSADRHRRRTEKPVGSRSGCLRQIYFYSTNLDSTTICGRAAHAVRPHIVVLSTKTSAPHLCPAMFRVRRQRRQSRCAFSNDRFGNATRRNPRLRSWFALNENVDLSKSFHFTEKLRLDYRAGGIQPAQPRPLRDGQRKPRLPDLRQGDRPGQLRAPDADGAETVLVRQ